MKLKIVQAVKLGTVACLLAVTTQTIGADNNQNNDHPMASEHKLHKNHCKLTKVTKSHEVSMAGEHLFTTTKKYTCRSDSVGDREFWSTGGDRDRGLGSAQGQRGWQPYEGG